jgi:uncharacterized membrane protein YedE/YeeE
MKRGASMALVAVTAGALFGAGLVLSGMTQPAKVIGFLDPGGAWDASLACVMLGAIGVHAIGYQSARARRRPLFAESFALPTRSALDAPLIAGAAIFGVGWGLGGYCPGPALVSLVSGNLGCITFVSAMLLGTWLAARFELRRAAPRAAEPE